MPEGIGLFAMARDRLRSRHMAYRTERIYLNWMRRYVRFHDRRHPREMGAAELERFLTYLAVVGKVSASTQNQALQALLFLYRHVLEVDLPWLENVTRATRPRRLPVVLTISEVQSVLAQLEGTHWLIASLLYGGGLRLLEALRLRVKDLVLERNEIIVRSGKGDKDRVTAFPSSLLEPMRAHLSRLHLRYVAWRRRREPGVSMSPGLSRKYPAAATQWAWQYVFPADQLFSDVYSGLEVRHHLLEKSMQRAMQKAVERAGVLQPATCQTLRHCLPPIYWRRVAIFVPSKSCWVMPT